MEYPRDLPCPQIEGYQIDVDYGATSVTFERGNRRQRRAFTRETVLFNLSLVLSTSQLWTWQSWANQYGFDWHYMDMPSPFSGRVSETNQHFIRYTGDFSIEAIDQQYFRVSLQAEFSLDTAVQAAAADSGNWVISGAPTVFGSPPAPLSIASDWIIARTPDNLPADTIIAGSPRYPAAPL